MYKCVEAASGAKVNSILNFEHSLEKIDHGNWICFSIEASDNPINCDYRLVRRIERANGLGIFLKWVK